MTLRWPWVISVTANFSTANISNSWDDLRDYWRSSEFLVIVQFDRSYTILYSSSIVTGSYKKSNGQRWRWGEITVVGWGQEQWRWDGMECCIAAGTWKFIPDQYFCRNGTGKLLRVHFSMTGLHYKCRADTCSSLGGLRVLQYAD